MKSTHTRNLTAAALIYAVVTSIASAQKIPLPHTPSAYAREGLMVVLTAYGHKDIKLRKSEVNSKST